MKRFALLLPHATDRYSRLSTEEYAEVMGDYFAWVQARVAEGTYKAGHKLSTHEGRHLTTRGGALEVHDIPSTEIAEVVGGIMIIEAEDLDAAVDAVRDHPHLRHNHDLLVLPVDPASES